MKDLTVGNELKAITLFSLPLLLGNIFQQLYNIVDSVVVGQFIGSHALAAVGQSFPIIFIFISLIMGFTMAANILLAQFYGARQIEQVKKVIHTTIIILFWCGIVISVLGYITTPWTLRIIHTPPEIYSSAVEYLQIIFIGMLFTFGYNGYAALLRGFGDSKTPLYGLIISTILNIILDLLFVAVFHWGVKGAAWATIISQGVAMFWLIAYAQIKIKEMQVNFFKLRFDKAICSDSIKLGLPSGIQQALVGAGLTAMTSIVNTFGADAAAAYAAVGKLDSFAVMPAINIGMAISSFTGQNLGAKKTDRVRRGLRSSLFLGCIAVGISVLIILTFASFFLRIFGVNDEALKIGLSYLKIVAPGYILQSTMFIVGGVIRGAGDTLFAMISTLLAMWLVRVPLAYALSPHLSYNGVWLAIVIGFAIGCAANILYYFFGPWRKRAEKILRMGER
ncbi:MATE family efflux transporter [Treponema phagedenis]|uniref:MATE family efflux transporter n=1 Tax=Treponema phagedenis TaxID=162 RepID=UPI000463C1C2|nr:MATE family efflux transporter [Treponema phagedenis]QEK01446.1 MATE family efflux transporter [Treponema phagedenis]QEK06466.1 MATE family efflux transporter [Treponema phagedenis]